MASGASGSATNVVSSSVVAASSSQAVPSSNVTIRTEPSSTSSTVQQHHIVTGNAVGHILHDDDLDDDDDDMLSDDEDLHGDFGSQDGIMSSVTSEITSQLRASGKLTKNNHKGIYFMVISFISKVQPVWRRPRQYQAPKREKGNTRSRRTHQYERDSKRGSYGNFGYEKHPAKSIN